MSAESSGVAPGYSFSAPSVELPFTPPIAFYRSPDDLTVGITEMLEVFPGDVAIDPLEGGDWAEFVVACRNRGRKVYGWARIGSLGTAWYFGESCRRLGIAQTFPNIEDDDLRSRIYVEAFLQYVLDNCRAPVGVLTNYFVSDLWPPNHPLSHLPVLPEWFPREITDPTATLEGSLDSGRKHFAAALPLLDGREERGLEAFPYPAGAYSIWPADNVTDWSRWVR